MTSVSTAPPAPSPVHRTGSGRVLHLVDSDDPVGGSGGPLGDLLADRPTDRVLAVGHGDHPDAVARLIPAGRRMLGSRGRELARVLRALALSGEHFDVIHAWGTRPTAMIGSLRGGPAGVVTLDSFLMDGTAATDAAVALRSGRLESMFGSRRAQAAAFELGGSSSSRSGRERVACPCVNPDRLADRREELRHRWAVDDDALVIGVIGEPMPAINLRDLAGLSVRCSLLGRETIVVASSRASRRGDVVRWIEGAGPTVRLVLDDIVERTREVARGLDVALAPGLMGQRTRVAGVAPVMTAVAAGLPVILGDGHPAAECAEWEPLLCPDRSHDEHGATCWLMARLDAGPGDAADRAQDRFDRYRQAVNACYARAVSAVAAS
ncbi:MAG: hypothetical protein MK116_00925 [Phycisphaerales bacterium]|nr:hypothetical protein [Phycisphaerales bacterium]